jgi:hypothetical protein
VDSSISYSLTPTRGFPLGEPPRDDVEGAAKLLLRYEHEAPLDADHAAMFVQMCMKPGEVIARYRELGGTTE